VSDSAHFSLENLPPLREVIHAHNLRAEKSLGQNFLLDSNITDKIVNYVRDFLKPEATVFEIGPGPGGLTRSILRMHSGPVVALEFDERAIQALEDLKKVAQGRLNLVHGDALRIDIASYSAPPRAVIANLPYNIATPLLISWLSLIEKSADNIDVMALMFQKEVADRITASPSSKAYGRLSVICQWLCRVQRVYDLPPSAFTPPPKVTSSVVRFVPKMLESPQPSFKLVEQVTAAAFNQRRKMIRSSLRSYLPAIEAYGLDPELRAENLSVDNFINLALIIEQMNLQ